MEGHQQCTQITALVIPSTEGFININTQVGVRPLGSLALANNRTVPERPEPRLEPLLTVPFPQDPHFVSRDAILHQIHDKASIPGSRIALVGLGGVGLEPLTLKAVRLMLTTQQENATCD